MHDATQNRTLEYCPRTCAWSLIPDSDTNPSHGQATFLNVPLFPLFSLFISPLFCLFRQNLFFHSYFCADHCKITLISIKDGSAVNCWLLKYYQQIPLQYHCKPWDWFKSHEIKRAEWQDCTVLRTFVFLVYPYRLEWYCSSGPQLKEWAGSALALTAHSHLLLTTHILLGDFQAIHPSASPALLLERSFQDLV